MGVKERKQREREQRRQEILDAARGLVMSEGPANLTMDRVAEVTELSKGTLYLYFASRADLLGTLVVEHQRDLTAVMRQAAAQREDPLEALEAVGKAYWAFARERATLAPLLEIAHTRVFSDGLSTELMTRLKEEGQGSFVLMTELVRKAQALGRIRARQDPLVLALALAASSTGVMQMGSALDGCGLPIEPERLLVETWTLILRSVIVGDFETPAPPPA